MATQQALAGAEGGPTGKPLGPRVEGARAALRALAWNYSGAVVGTVLQLGYTAYTGRMVRPGVYGAFTTAASALTVLGFFAGAGCATYLLREERPTRQKVWTACAVAVGGGVLCCAAVQAGAPLIAAVWGLPETVPLLRLAAWGYLVQYPALVAAAGLRRLGQARTATLAEVLAQFLGMAVGSVLLGIGWNPQGMVIAPIVTSACCLAVCGVRLTACRFEAGPRVSVGSLVGSSSAFAGYGLIQSLTLSTPMWGAARALGPVAAGQFARASIAVGLPLGVLHQSLYRAVTPALARVNGEGRPLGGAVRDVLAAASAVAFVMFGPLAAVGPAALRVLLGPGWEQACALVPLLCLGAAFSLLYSTGCFLDEVRKVMGHLLRLNLAVLGLTAAAVVIAAATTRSLFAITAAVAAATGCGHLLQILRWRRERLLRPASLARPYLVHAVVGAALFGCGRAGVALGGSAPSAIGHGLLAMLPVVLAGIALRRRLPLYQAAVARGLLS